MSPLALHGGPPVVREPFPAYNTIAAEETRAVTRVMGKGVLSAFVGAAQEAFYGGEEVRALEQEWAEYFAVPHAVSMNSATSALQAAMGACGIEPGDEVIVPPTTMAATATCPLIYGGIPVFADIDPITFCLDPRSVEDRITSRTRAIIAVNLFGQAAPLEALAALARRRGLRLVEDNAQSAGARHHGRPAGTIGDIGVFSLNCYKNIQCGEGGIAVTRDKELAYRLQLIRNHAEVVMLDEAWQPASLANMVGFNFRMTELQAAIAREQLKKLEGLNARRRENTEFLNEKLRAYPCLTPPRTRPENTHVYYVQALLFDEEQAGCSRSAFLGALKAEGVQMAGGYVKPLHLLPLFQERIAFGSKGHPFSLRAPAELQSYGPGLCPVAEELHLHRLFTNTLIHANLERRHLAAILEAVDKVLAHASELAPVGPPKL